MAERPSIQKLPESARFLDLSDYARPLAALLVAALLPTRVSPIHITLVYTAVGLVAAGLFGAGRYGLGVVAGLLLLLKSALDAADGSLARARERPSRVGRYLDSICDFLVNLAVFGGLAFAEAASGRGGSVAPYVIAAAALLLATLEGSVFNYYYVLRRRQTGGDVTSLLDESQARAYPWDPPRLVAALQTAYLVIYGWQDQFVAWLDHLATGGFGPQEAPAPSAAFLTATTALGLGTQLLFIALLAFLGHPFWAMYIFLGPALALWGMLLAIRARSKPQRVIGK